MEFSGLYPYLLEFFLSYSYSPLSGPLLIVSLLFFRRALTPSHSTERFRCQAVCCPWRLQRALFAIYCIFPLVASLRVQKNIQKSGCSKFLRFLSIVLSVDLFGYHRRQFCFSYTQVAISINININCVTGTGTVVYTAIQWSPYYSVLLCFQSKIG